MAKAAEHKRTGDSPVRFRIPFSLRGAQALLVENSSLAWQNRIFYLFITPFAVLTILFGAWPIILSIIVSFTDSYSALGDAPVFIGFANFAKIFADPLFVKSLYNTTLFTIAAVVLNVGLALSYESISKIWRCILPSRDLSSGHNARCRIVHRLEMDGE